MDTRRDTAASAKFPVVEPDFDVAWSIVKGLAFGSSTDRELVGLLHSAELDWAQVLNLVLRHRQTAALADLLVRHRADLSIPGGIWDSMLLAREGMARRLALFGTHLEELVEALSSASIPFAVTKGTSFHGILYAPGVRHQGDIDLMIAPASREAVRTLLSTLGYVEGRVNQSTRAVEPLSRRERILYALSPDHLPTHNRLTRESGVPAIEVDVANSFTWHGAEFEVDVEEALSHRHFVEVDCFRKVRVPSLDPHYQVLFTCLHLFREAWFERWENDVNLMKFGDVLRLLRASQSEFAGGSLETLVRRLRVERPVAWVLEHLDRVAGTNLTRDLGFAGICSAEYLASEFVSGGGTRLRTGTVEDRLRARQGQRATSDSLAEQRPLR